MRGLTLLYAFVGGAAVGAAAALLFAPEKGEKLREEIKHYLKKNGLCKRTKAEDLEILVEEIAEEIEKE